MASLAAAAATLLSRAAVFLRRLPANDFGHLAHHFGQHSFARPQEGEGGFELELDLILEGLRAS